MADTSRDMEYAELRQNQKDEDLCKEIVEVLGRDGPQRVLLAGEAGIGKTRLAKLVGEHATVTGRCFLTICLHLNKKYDDEWSLYENVASQLSVYSDFEETEVDDRDEDEEENKKPDALLVDLKKKITDEIEDQAKKAKELAEKKVKELAEKKAKEQAEKAKEDKAGKNVKKQQADGKEKLAVAEKTPAEGEKKDIPFAGTPYLLLILDDEGNKLGEDKTSEYKTIEDKVMKGLKLEKFLREQTFLKDDNSRLKILSTRRTGDEEPPKPAGEIVTQDTKSEGGNDSDGEIRPVDSDNKGKTEPQDPNNAHLIQHDGKGVSPDGDEPKDAVKCYDEIKFLTTDKSEALRKSIDSPDMKDLFAALMKDEWKTYEKLTRKIVDKSRNSPAAIVVLAKSLKRITPSTPVPEKGKELKGKELEEKELIERIEKKIEEVLSADRSDSLGPGSSSERDINPVLCLAYELLEIGFPLKDAILDCFWHSLDFFEHCGCVYYRDLITQWILEGYFDPVRSVEKAYQDGHLILMELINRGMLKIQENNVVVPERTMRTLIDPRRRGLFGRSKLRFSRVYRGDKKKGIGKITQIDDMIKTVQAKKGDSITTILVSGDRLRRVTPGKYFEKLGDLEVLGLFEPTLEPFVPALLQRPKNVAQRELEKLRVLVIRDCDLLNSIEELKALRGLNVLEVSGASSLKKITDDFFKALSKLQSLHLSGLMIESSPPSISELTELHCLIIKNCPLLKDLPDIQELKKLEVVDVSGAHGLKTCFDNTPGEKKNKSKNKNFYHLTRLQLLDFSESQIERLPIFQDSAVGDKLHSVTRLLLRDCTKLRRLPSLKPLSGLQILDLSGTTSLVEMLEVCFEDKKELTTLNLTGTNLSELATTIDELTNLKKLLLKDSKNLEVIPNISKLTNLEVIDVSGCTKLHTIEGSFEDMHYLREIDLTDTKVMTPPELPTDTKITCPKRITLADGRVFGDEKWSEITDKIKGTRSDKDSSSEASQEISENEPEETGEIQPSVTRASASTEKGDFTKERLLQVPIKRDIYKNILSHFDSISQKEVMKIHETEDLSNAEFVSFVDINSTSLKSIFSEAKSVKVFSLKMCRDIKEIFSAEDEKSLGSLKTLSLSITNLPLLEKISCGVSFQNLKELHVECCPNIKTLFLEAAQMPSSLEVLHIKYCEKLEKVFEEGEVSTLTTLCLYELPLLSAVGAKLPNLETFDTKMCPKLLVLKEDLTGWVEVDPSDASPQN